MKKEMKEIVKALEEQGFEVRTTKRGHVAVYRDGRFVVMFAGTPSDWRGMRNGIVKARRHGFRWP